MKTVIKYCAILFALLLAGSIISGCVKGSVMVVRAIAEKDAGKIKIDGKVVWDINDLLEEGAFGEVNGGFRIFGVQFGGTKETKSGAYNVTEPVHEIRVDGVDGALEIIRGETFSVTYQNIPVEYKMEIRDGVLMLHDESKHVVVVNFGGSDAHLCLMIPEGTELQKITVDNGAGSLKMSDVSAKRIRLDGGSGSMSAEGVTSESFFVDGGSGSVTLKSVTTKEAGFDMGSGALHVSASDLGALRLNSGSGGSEFKNVQAENMTVDSGSGRVMYKGVLTGNCIFDTGSGSVRLDIEGRKSDYNIRANVGSGGFYVDGKKEKTSGIGVTNYGTAIYTLVFNSGSGRVSVNFSE